MIEAMKQTLKALERSVATCFDQYSHQQVMSQPDHFINQAITSLRKAIAEAEKQEQGEPDDEVLGFNGWGFPIEPPPNPKQQQGEPVTLEEIRKAMIFGIPLYTHPQPKAEKQEPVGWIDSKGNMLCVKINESCRPLYTQPQPRKPLTDEQIDDLARTMVKGNKSVNWLARAIEAAHGIGVDK